MRQKKEKRRIAMTLFIVLIMIGSVAGFVVNYGSPDQDLDTFEYNGHTFTRTNQGFVTTVNNRQVQLVLDPQIVESIPSDSVSISEFNSASKIYLTFNPDDNFNTAASYFHSSIGPHLHLPIFQACTEDIGGICEDLPIKTCEDATNEEKIIVFQKNDDNSVTYENNCLIIQGSSDLVSTTQKAIQQLLGII